MAKKKVTLKRGLGTKHFTKERFEALRKMVDMENIGTITCDKNEALELAQADFSLMGFSSRTMVFGSRWIYKPPCRRRLRSRATGTSRCEVLHVTEKSTGCEIPLVVCVVDARAVERTMCKICYRQSLPGQLHLQVESCEQVLENPDITSRVLESR